DGVEVDKRSFNGRAVTRHASAVYENVKRRMGRDLPLGRLDILDVKGERICLIASLSQGIGRQLEPISRSGNKRHPPACLGNSDGRRWPNAGRGPRDESRPAIEPE